MRLSGAALVLGVCAVASAAESKFSKGRDIGDKRDFQVRVVAGQVMELEGFVEETTRAFYDATDQSFKQADAERFDLDDFEVDGGFATVGFSLERAWKYITFQFDLLGMNPTTDAVARRNYYISVDEVTFQGRQYENMQIPEGTPFSADIFGTVVGLNGLYTPFSYRPSPNVRFTPMIGLGLFLFFGTYDIDAGPARGTTLYEFPPEEYVVAGSAEGFLGAGIPELVLGGELVFGAPDKVNFAVQGTFGYFAYDGSTRYLTTSDEREKNADIDHFHTRLRLALELPMKSGRAFTVGAQYELIESDAYISSKAGTVEQIIERRERFDKDIDFRLSAGTGFVGLTF